MGTSVKLFLYALATLLVVIVVVLIVWVVDMAMRPSVNKENLDYALEKRELCKIRCPVLARDQDGAEDSSVAAGSGASIPFDFATSTLEGGLPANKKKSVSWSSNSGSHLHLGTRRFGTPRQNCVLVAWGYEKQQSLLSTKIA